MRPSVRNALWILIMSVAPILAQATPADDLHALFEAEWQRWLETNPTVASSLGDARYNDRWPDLSVEALAASTAADEQDLTALLAIDRAALGDTDQVDYDLFRRRLENRLSLHRFGRRYLYRYGSFPVSQSDGPHTAYGVAESLRFTSERDYRDWIRRLQTFGVYTDQNIALLVASIDAGIVQPRVLVQRIADQLPALIVDDPADSPFFRPLLSMPETIPDARREELRAAAESAIDSIVTPALRRFQVFVAETWLPAARESYGTADEPDGAAFYADRVRYFTTTELTPREIHELGLAEVGRIRALMDAVIESVGFDGSFDEFLLFLRTDPRFYYEDPQALLDAYRSVSKRIDPGLVTLFGRLPRMPYGVRPIADAVAPHTTTAYYSPPAADGSRAGHYYVNLYRPETRPRYEIEVLTIHEAVPGHHLQVALTMELGELPAFRRHDYLTAYVEGWALYSESLGEALGLYQDPYSRFGQLTYEMWRAVRLVLDTGIHAFGWDRQKAIDYFKANAAKTELDIVNEVDRYIAWPGQALAYKIGELRIQSLRALAEDALGAEFDIRAFHDQLLGGGPVPLDLLETRTRAWIDRQQAAE